MVMLTFTVDKDNKLIDIKIDLDRSLDIAFLSTQHGCYERNMDLGLFIRFIRHFFLPYI